jgi:hypothetical protein
VGSNPGRRTLSSTPGKSAAHVVDVLDHAVGRDPGTHPARGAVPLVRPGARGLGRRHEVTYVPSWPTQLVAARTVAEALVNLANGSGPLGG